MVSSGILAYKRPVEDWTTKNLGIDLRRLKADKIIILKQIWDDIERQAWALDVLSDRYQLQKCMARSLQKNNFNGEIIHGKQEPQYKKYYIWCVNMKNCNVCGNRRD